MSSVPTHHTIFHEPGIDKPSVKTYEGITRRSYGMRYQIEMQESGKFYCNDLTKGCVTLAQYGEDIYGWNTVACPIKVTIYKALSDGS